MDKIVVVFSRFIMLGALCLQLGFAWQRLEPGLNYDKYPFRNLSAHSYLHIFRIDPKRYRLTGELAEKHYTKASLVAHLASQRQAQLAINAGFFTPEYKILGLRVYDGKVRSPLRRISWWDIFTIHGTQARIISSASLDSNKQLDFAVQAGPRLIRQGTIPRLKPGFADRTALGIDQQGFIILAITEQAPIQTTTLAKILRDDYHCVDALNLDGGSSTQLFADFKQLQLNISYLSYVPDAIVILAR